MTTRGILVLVGFALIIFGVLFFSLSNKNQQNNINDPDGNFSNNENILGPVELWEVYNSGLFVNGWGFTINHPKEVQVSNVQEGVVTLKYIGPNSEPQTEITDGFLLTIRGESPSTLDAYVRNANPTTSVQVSNLHGYESRVYATTSELGNTEVKHIVFKLEKDQPGEGTVIDISSIASGDEAEEYEEIISQMIKTIVFAKQ